MQPPPLTPEIALTLAVAAGAMGLFFWGRLSVDVVGLLVLAALLCLGLVELPEGLRGFSDEATLTVAAMLVLSAGLSTTGTIDALSRWVARLSGGSETRLLLMVVLCVVPTSAFINNTAAVATLMPVVLGIAREQHLAASRLLMPLSFASQLGGTLTLVGTSTNLLVAGLMVDFGLHRFGLFEITPPALVLMGLGVLYLLTVGRLLTPSRQMVEEPLTGSELREYLSALEVEEGSPLARRSLEELRLRERYGLEVVGLQRGGQRLQAFPGVVIHPGDLLLVRGQSSRLKQVDGLEGVRLVRALPAMKTGEQPPRLAELMVPPRSHLVGHTLGDLDKLAWEGVMVLALQRHGEALQGSLEDVVLMPGDLLLVEGSQVALRRLHQAQLLALLGPVELPAQRQGKMKLAVGLVVLVVLVAALNILPILVAALLGVLAMFLTGCIEPQEAYERLDWKVLVLLGAIIPLGIAMENTGTADFLASRLLMLTRSWGSYGTLAALYLLTSLMTEVISNNAAAVVLTPVGISVAEALGLSPLPFVVAVMFAGSNSFMTPIGYQTNTFIYGPGGYRFSDFVRVGGPLNLLLLAAATFVIPHFFPFLPR
jgi:di/tricarboxylate transporter